MISQRVLVLPTCPGRDAKTGFRRAVFAEGKRKSSELGIEQDRSLLRSGADIAVRCQRSAEAQSLTLARLHDVEEAVDVETTTGASGLPASACSKWRLASLSSPFRKKGRASSVDADGVEVPDQHPAQGRNGRIQKRFPGFFRNAGLLRRPDRGEADENKHVLVDIPAPLDQRPPRVRGGGRRRLADGRGGRGEEEGADSQDDQERAKKFTEDSSGTQGLPTRTIPRRSAHPVMSAGEPTERRRAAKQAALPRK